MLIVRNVNLYRQANKSLLRLSPRFPANVQASASDQNAPMANSVCSMFLRAALSYLVREFLGIETLY